MRALFVLALALVACTGAASSSGDPEPPCSLDAECVDSVACTRDRCVAGACRHDPEALACDDANACTRDACHPEKGCLNLADRDGQTCDDDDGCTTGDLCANGACGGTPVSCADDDPCTADACDPIAAACAHTAAPDGVACDDGQPCTSGDRCQAGACVGGATTCECADDAACAAADDDDRCNGSLACRLNHCEVDPATVVACETSADSECAKTVCEKATGACVPLTLHEGLACAPLTPCANGGTCVAGVCVVTTLVDCDDGDPCTTDACDEATGACASAAGPPGAPCDDGQACTTVDACDASGACVGGSPVVCDDGNPCTADLCKPSTGACVFAAAFEGEPCDDVDPCTEDEACADGTCGGGTPVSGCCHDDGECPAPGVCRSVACGAAHTCDVSLQPDCCGNGNVDGAEACDPGGSLAAGACDDACAFQAFDVGAGLTGSVTGAAVAPWLSHDGYRVAVTLAGSATPDAPGLYLVDVGADGRALGQPLKVAGASAVVAGVAVQPKLGDPLVSWMADELTEVVWMEPPASVRAQGVRGVATLVGLPAQLLTTPDFIVRPPVVEQPPLPARATAVRFVQSEEGCPTIAAAVPAALDPDGPGADTLPPNLSPLLAALLRTDGSQLAQPTPNLMVDLVDDSGTEPVGLWTWGAHESLTVSGPAWVQVGPYHDLVSVRVLDAGTAHPRVDLVRRFFWDSHPALGIDQVLWSVEGTDVYPFSPAVVEGNDASSALVVFPLQTAPWQPAPPLGLVRMTYDDDVLGPFPVLAEKTTISLRHELVRLGVDRLALVYDVVKPPEGTESPDAAEFGLAYAVLAENGDTVVPPTELLAPGPRKLPMFGALARSEGGFVVFFVDDVEGEGRLRARFVAAPAE